MLRLLSAAVLAPILWATIRLAPAWVFCLLVAGAIAIGCRELCHMLDRRGSRSFPWLAIVSSLAVAWSFAGHAPRYETVLPILGLVILTMVVAMWRRDDPAGMLESTLATLFPVVFIGLTLSYLIRLRGMPGEDGADLLLLLFLCVIFADTAAFYGGSNFGRHRMTPRISPNKSWEGAIFGLIGSLAAGMLAHYWFFQRLPLHHALILGVVLGLAGIFGDLAESLVKRASEVKDSSNLIPGHGGLLDRADSLLFAAPILYYYYRIFL